MVAARRSGFLRGGKAKIMETEKLWIYKIINYNFLYHYIILIKTFIEYFIYFEFIIIIKGVNLI